MWDWDVLRFSTACVVKEVGDDVSKCQCLLSYWVNSAASKVLNCADLPLFKVVLFSRGPLFTEEEWKSLFFLNFHKRRVPLVLDVVKPQKKFVVKVTSNPTQNIDEMYQKHRQWAIRETNPFCVLYRTDPLSFLILLVSHSQDPFFEGDTIFPSSSATN